MTNEKEFFTEEKIRLQDEYYEIRNFIQKYGYESPLTYIQNYMKPIGYMCPDCLGRRLKDIKDISDKKVVGTYICKTCHGTGYTKNKMKPHIVQDGWEPIIGTQL